MDVTIKLEPFDRAHLAQARAWRNSWEVWGWCRQNDLISDVDQERWHERQAADPTIRMYAVVREVGGDPRLVGVAGLTSLDWPNRRAEFSLYIGPEHQRSGHGRLALRVLLDHAFRNLGLHQVWGEVFVHNKAALKTFDVFGFKVDGRLRQRYWKNGQWIDTYMISLLADEWRAANAKPGDGAPAPDAAPASREPSASGASPAAAGAKRRPGRRLKAVAAEAPGQGAAGGGAADGAADVGPQPPCGAP